METHANVLSTARVHVVDDDAGFRTGLTRVLNASGLHAVGYGCAGEFLLADLSDAHGCILLDVCMPGPSGIELMDALATRESSMPVIFVTGHDDIPTSVHAMKSGAMDFLLKPVRTETLLTAVHNAIAADQERRRARSELRRLRARYASLTERERLVFVGVVQGKLNKQLAGELDTCERTIKAHRARMMAKLGATLLVELVRAADLLGLQ